MGRLTDDQIQSAADTLIALREKRLVLGGLPADVTPECTEDIQRIISAVSARIERPVRGWKIYTLHKPMHPPFYAPIYDLFPNGAAIPAEISPLRMIEPEIMFRVDRDLPARERQYDPIEVMESVTAVVGYEVIGSRFDLTDRSNRDAGGERSLYGSLSDHIANGCIVIGDAIPGWRDVAFEDVRLRVTEGGREIISVVGCHPYDNPFLPVAMGVNRLRRHRGVKAGDILITSSSTSSFMVPAGALIRATYEGLGEVTATFAKN